MSHSTTELVAGVLRGKPAAVRAPGQRLENLSKIGRLAPIQYTNNS